MRRRSGLLVPAAMAIIVFVCVVVDVALHRGFAWIFDVNYLDNGLPPSVLITSGVFPLAAFAGFAAMFAFVALVYARARRELGGMPVATALRFCAPIALIMFFGVLESAFVFPTPFRAEIITAVADALPYLLLGLLLGYFAAPEAEQVGRSGAELAPWQSMLWVALVYVAGRYIISYPVLHIVSGYIDRPGGTFIWTIACGLSMGSFYWLAGSALSPATPTRRALRVAAILGIFWLMVQLFYALIFAVSVLDLVVRGAADTVYLFAAIYSFETLFRSGKAPTSASSPTHPAESARRPQSGTDAAAR
jgi:hypothetical protein